MPKRLLALASIALPMFAGCAGGPTQSKSDASEGWRSTQVALAQAGVSTGLSGTASVGPDGAQGAVMGTVQCPDGGTLEVSASGEVTENTVDAELHIAFAACEVDGLVIDGALDYSAYVDSERISAEYHGDLEWSGKVEGSCSIDASAEVDASGIHASLKGNVCGHDWSDL